MHAVAIQLAPIIGAEKSKVPFYIAGGLLVVWAVFVSIGLGMRKPSFPGNASGERAVIAITVVLVLAAASMAVVTSGTPASSAAASAAPTGAAVSTPAPAGAATQPAASTGASTTTTTPVSSPSPRGAGSSLKLAANPSGALSYSTKQLSARAGRVTITMTNMSPLEHNLTVAQGSTVVGATPTFRGGARTLTLNLKPGTYTFYCSVPGHRQGGMEGTLTVS
jgi:plastocyanin